MTLEKKYSLYVEKKISGLRIPFQDISSLIDELSPNFFKKIVLGYSENQIPIYSIQFGNGNIKIALWSQMHGDESTATKSMFDLFNYFYSNKEKSEIQTLLKKCTFLFIPMLNPDGAMLYTRENALGIDLNRDAKTLQTNEARILYNTICSFSPDFAFNLHDQTAFYSVKGTKNTATLSFLAPSSDSTKQITTSRSKAMQVIATMHQALQGYIPNAMGRYDDSFNDNCFGDTFQSLGFSTILIESGYFPGDENREVTRKLHFIALLTAFEAIVTNILLPRQLYDTIPMNYKNYYNYRLDNVLYKGKITSLGIRCKYVFKETKLKRQIDFDEILEITTQNGELFYSIIDCKGKLLREFSC